MPRRPVPSSSSEDGSGVASVAVTENEKKGSKDGSPAIMTMGSVSSRQFGQEYTKSISISVIPESVGISVSPLEITAGEEIDIDSVQDAPIGIDKSWKLRQPPGTYEN